MVICARLRIEKSGLAGFFLCQDVMKKWTGSFVLAVLRMTINMPLLHGNLKIVQQRVAFDFALLLQAFDEDAWAHVEQP